MSYQLIRAEMEKLTHAALVQANVNNASIFFDNVQETPGSPTETYATIALNFNEVAIQSLGCNIGAIKGSLAVNIYTPKAEGSGKGEAIAAEVLASWLNLNQALAVNPHRCRTSALEGPKTIAPDKRPHHCNNVACSFTAIAV